MDLMRVIDQLRRERDQIAEAIRSLERLELATAPKRRGRPPKNRKALSIPTYPHTDTKAAGLRHPKTHASGGGS